jgi:hypothetical protein
VEASQIRRARMALDGANFGMVEDPTIQKVFVPVVYRVATEELERACARIQPEKSSSMVPLDGARRPRSGGGPGEGCARRPVGAYLYLHAMVAGNHVALLDFSR